MKIMRSEKSWKKTIRLRLRVRVMLGIYYINENILKNSNPIKRLKFTRPHVCTTCRPLPPKTSCTRVMYTYIIPILVYYMLIRRKLQEKKKLPNYIYIYIVESSYRVLRFVIILRSRVVLLQKIKK